MAAGEQAQVTFGAFRLAVEDPVATLYFHF
jgi:hypothetical protein